MLSNQPFPYLSGFKNHCCCLQVRREMEGQAGGKLDIPALPDFDSNIITPGTEFMARLATEMRRFFAVKLLNDEDWRHLSVGCQHYLQGWRIECTGLALFAREDRRLS